MLTSDLKSQIDRVWEAFWTGGLSNPLTVIEQMTYLLFIRRLDELQTQKEQKANLLKQAVEAPIFLPEETELRWSRFKDLDPENMFRLFTKQGTRSSRGRGGRGCIRRSRGNPRPGCACCRRARAAPAPPG